MNKQRLFQWVFVLVMIAIPWLYLAIIWDRLPDTIPTHFGINGTPDKFGDKSEVFLGPAIMSVTSILLYLLLTNIYKIDPKRYAKKQGGVFVKMGLAIVVFFTCVTIFILNWTLSQHTIGLNLFLVALGLLFAYIGNIMHSIKPNYFAGLRLPWTLESEENWKATHMLAGKLWFAGGLLIAVLAIIVKPIIMFFIMFGIILTMILIPAVYSYRYFKKEKARQPE
jgi:uncharacterized membrane protein